MRLFLLIIFVIFTLFSCDRKWDNNYDDNSQLIGVLINEAIEITGNSVKLQGKIINRKNSELIEKGICWDTIPDVNINSNIVLAENKEDTLCIYLDKLKINTTYYFKSYAINDIGIGYSEERFFNTSDGKPLGVLTLKIKELTEISAVCVTGVNSDNGFPILKRGICWGLENNPDFNDNNIEEGEGIGQLNYKVPNLQMGKSYYIRAYATNENGISFGNTIVFNCAKIQITTSVVSNIRSVYAICGGEILDTNVAIAEKGVCWSKSQNPTINNFRTTEGDGTSEFESTLSNLSLNTKYYVRAYATNESGIVYGGEQSFLTLDGLPSGITTKNVSQITGISALSGGEIIDDGDFSILRRGVCWSTDPSPTIQNEHSNEGEGLGDFLSEIENLEPKTLYYIRSFATNDIGTSYGNQLSFTTDKPDITGQTGVLTDFDGNTYKWVGIGKQAWMAENLNVTHYANGTSIPFVSDSATWRALRDHEDAYCYYQNNTEISKGALYNWRAALGDIYSHELTGQIQGVCPDGWHLPSKTEWQKLILFIISEGYGDQIGAVLKSTEGWLEDGNGIDIYGFGGIPGGARSMDGSFWGNGSGGYWWSSTTESNLGAATWSLGSYFSNLESRSFYRNVGASIRCIRND